MAFNNRRTNQSNDRPKNISTKILQLYSNDQDTPTSLSLNIWKNFLSVGITPELPKDQQTDSMVYDYNNTVSVLLNQVQVKALINGIKELKALKKSKGDDAFHSVTIIGRDDVMIKISDGSEYELNTWVLTMIFKEEKAYEYYVFNNEGDDVTLFFNYDEDTNKAQKRKILRNCEFDTFVASLDLAFEGMSSAHSHFALDSIYRLRNIILDRLEIIKNFMETALLGRGSLGSSNEDSGGSYRRPQSGRFSNRSRRSSSSDDDNTPSIKSSRSRKLKESDLEDEYNAAIDETEETPDSLEEFMALDDED